MGILLVLFAFVVIIAIHELGHALACIWFGVGITEFSVGFGPTLYTWQTKKFPVHFKLFFILGGYVRIKSRKDDKSLETEGNFLEDIGLPKQIFIFLAGILANLLTAIMARTLIFWFAPQNLVVHYGPLTLQMAECPGPWYLAPLYATKTVFVFFFRWMYSIIAAVVIMAERIIQFSPAEGSGFIAMGRAMQSTTENSPDAVNTAWSIVALFYYFSVIVASFNILPFLPFDGGQVVRFSIARVFGWGKITKYISTALTVVGLGIVGIICVIIIISDAMAIWRIFAG